MLFACALQATPREVVETPRRRSLCASIFQRAVRRLLSVPDRTRRRANCWPSRRTSASVQICLQQMIKRLFSITFVVSINFAILGLCLALIEFGFRVANTNESGGGRSLQWLQFSPFMMFTLHPDPSSNVYEWHDQFHKQSIHAKIFTNRLGFAMRQEVDFSRLRSKAENERVVLFTGGSAAWGVGATSNETNIAGRMQAILNGKQANYHYTVLNLAMIGWVSFQQLIALAMFGPNLQPDWLVSMDGTNDAAVTCYSSQGAGYPMYYGLMEAYMKAYAFGQAHPVFYRGWLENQ